MNLFVKHYISAAPTNWNICLMVFRFALFVQGRLNKRAKHEQKVQNINKNCKTLTKGAKHAPSHNELKFQQKIRLQFVPVY